MSEEVYLGFGTICEKHNVVGSKESPCPACPLEKRLAEMTKERMAWPDHDHDDAGKCLGRCYDMDRLRQSLAEKSEDARKYKNEWESACERLRAEEPNHKADRDEIQRLNGELNFIREKLAEAKADEESARAELKSVLERHPLPDDLDVLRRLGMPKTAIRLQNEVDALRQSLAEKEKELERERRRADALSEGVDFMRNERDLAYKKGFQSHKIATHTFFMMKAQQEPEGSVGRQLFDEWAGVIRGIKE